jgi:hypothetical protein
MAPPRRTDLYLVRNARCILSSWSLIRTVLRAVSRTIGQLNRHSTSVMPGSSKEYIAITQLEWNADGTCLLMRSGEHSPSYIDMTTHSCLRSHSTSLTPRNGSKLVVYLRLPATSCFCRSRHHPFTNCVMAWRSYKTSEVESFSYAEPGDSHLTSRERAASDRIRSLHLGGRLGRGEARCFRY